MKRADVERVRAAKRLMKAGATLRTAAQMAGRSKSALHRLAVAEKWPRLRRWTKKQKIEEARRMQAAGLTTREIGRLLKMSKGAVHRACQPRAA